jgi:hypothetical protein
MNISDLKLSKPAILLGNGLNNYYMKDDFAWLSLLNKLSNGKIIKSYFENGDLTYPECFDILSINSISKNKNFGSIKDRLSKQIIEWEGTEGHHKFTEFARDQNIPIITTNYDLTLVDDELKHAMKIKPDDKYNNMRPRKNIHSGKNFTDFYPWYTCYSDNTITDASKQFGIWHMHGISCYKRSLSIGASDYGNNISQYKKLLDNEKLINKSEWKGKNSWMDVFYNCDLVIVGLTLAAQETSLRWLLIKREKYYLKNSNLRKKTYFVVNKDYEKLGVGKKFFFDSIGTEIIEKSGKEIYEEWN